LSKLCKNESYILYPISYILPLATTDTHGTNGASNAAGHNKWTQKKGIGDRRERRANRDADVGNGDPGKQKNLKKEDILK